MNSVTGPTSAIVQKAKTRALKVYGPIQSPASRQTEVDYCVGYLECKKDINALFNNKVFVDKMYSLIQGQIVYYDSVEKVIRGALDEMGIKT